jgi:transposase-like protein
LTPHAANASVATFGAERQLMDKNIFLEPRFHSEEAARSWFETARWPNGPVCPHCGADKHYATKKIGRNRCANKECRKDFAVMTGTVMERSQVKLTEWAAAFHLAASSKKGFSAHQLHRSLGCQYNTAWFLGNPTGMFCYAATLDNGIGGPIDVYSAIKWYESAAQNGIKDATRVVEKLRSTGLPTNTRCR